MDRKKNIKLADIEPNKGQIEGLPQNPRFIKDNRFKQLVKSIEDAPEMLDYRTLLVFPHEKKYVVIAGNMRFRACKELRYKELPCYVLPEETPAEKLREYAIKDNIGFGADDWDILMNEWDTQELKEWGMEMPDDWGGNNEDNKMTENEDERHHLIDDFIVPPFSVFDTRQGYWQDRKTMWKEMGIQSELGRDVCSISWNLDNENTKSNPSIFDPVLCEVVYRWFGVDNGVVFDCFCGGSVRGIVAEKLGYKYTGIDLRQEQIDENEKQATHLGLNIKYICDDAINTDNYIDDNSVDLVFSCPPYFNLEKYSDDSRDLSNKTYYEFKIAYAEIIEKCCRKLKNNRFAVFVVGEVRDKSGFYINFVDFTKNCFIDNGLKFYNDIVLVEECVNAAMRASVCMKRRKVVKTHQNVLVFYKGNPKEITPLKNMKL